MIHYEGIDQLISMTVTPRFARTFAVVALSLCFGSALALEFESRQLLRTCQQVDSLTSCQLKLYGR